MKKKLIIFCFVAVATVSAVLYVQSRSNVDNDLFMKNVEALAEEEEDYGRDKPIWEKRYRDDGGYNCCKPGNEKCRD